MNTDTAEPVDSQVDSKKVQQIERSLADLTTIVSPRLTSHVPSASTLNDPPPAVTNLVHRIAKREEANETALAHLNRREAERVTYPNSVVVVPVDRRLVPQADPFKTLIQDVSESGLRLLHTRVVTAPFLIVSWRATALPLTSICLLLKITRSESRGLFYSIAGEFLLDDLDG